MVRVESENAPLTEKCNLVFAENGRLTTAIGGFQRRSSQFDMANAIALAIEKAETLVVEAGTGTGKTFAYLVPSLLSGKKILVSTATKTLQDQLFQKDIPRLITALGLSVRIENLKGRANYICRYRTQLYQTSSHGLSGHAAADIALVYEKMAKLKVGERGELSEISELSSAWPYVTSTVDNCLGGKCEYYDSCFLVKARKRAIQADLVVINHHLFFADSRLKETGFSEILPTQEVVIFDEAHQLASTAADFYGERVSTRQLLGCLEDLLREWPVLDLPNQPFKALYMELDNELHNFITKISTSTERLSWENLLKAGFLTIWQFVLEKLLSILACFEHISFDMEESLSRCHERLVLLRERWMLFGKEQTDGVLWAEKTGKHNLVLHFTPIDVSKSFSLALKESQASFVFTSATLTMAGSFHAFLEPLGLLQSKTLLLPSPFAFEEQALLYFPRNMPDPKDYRYYDIFVETILPIVNASQGRCFILFTSHRALQKVAAQLRNILSYPILIQGDESKSILLARFRELGNAVLLGTATFWEGVDVKGQMLSCVIIDKLPFSNPSDPVTRGKLAYLQSKGISAFDSYTLPEAVLALKQGVGRLIRDEQDKGLLVIADPRVLARNYGRLILESLPKVPMTRDKQKALAFIENF